MESDDSIIIFLSISRDCSKIINPFFETELEWEQPKYKSRSKSEELIYKRDKVERQITKAGQELEKIDSNKITNLFLKHYLAHQVETELKRLT